VPVGVAGVSEGPTRARRAGEDLAERSVGMEWRGKLMMLREAARGCVRQRWRPGRSVEESKRPRYSACLANVALAVGSMTVLLGTVEVVASLFVPRPIVWRYPQESYLYDRRLLHRLKPNQEAFTHSFHVATNSYGLRNEEFTPKPPPGTFRILCLGDSLTFGNGVDLSDTYPKQLEIRLNGAGRQRYEVINAGVPAYDTWQEVTYLREEGWQFEPNLVIIGFYANDIVPRPSRLTPPAGVARHEVKSRSDIANAAVYLLKRSRVLLLLRERFNQLMSQISPSLDVIHQQSLLRGTPHHYVEAGFREVDASFGELTTLAKEHEFAMIVVMFPMAEQIVAKYPNAIYPDRVKEIAGRHGIPVIDLMPAFEREFSGFGSLFIEWDGHPNARAYAIAAKKINEYLAATGLVGGAGAEVAAR
jgi:lysophospholipase L1-like esterase